VRGSLSLFFLPLLAREEELKEENKQWCDAWDLTAESGAW
jgi:hypothetical protein